MPEPMLAQVLNWMQSLKAEQLNESPHLTVSSAEGESRVPIESLKDEHLGIVIGRETTTGQIEQVCQELNTALRNSGYCSGASIVDLVREVKQEMLAEQESNQMLERIPNEQPAEETCALSLQQNSFRTTFRKGLQCHVRAYSFQRSRSTLAYKAQLK